MSAPPVATGESLPEKEARIRRKLEEVRRTAGADAKQTLYCMGHLVNVLRDQGKLVEAEAICREA